MRGLFPLSLRSPSPHNPLACVLAHHPPHGGVSLGGVVGVVSVIIARNGPWPGPSGFVAEQTHMAPVLGSIVPCCAPSIAVLAPFWALSGAHVSELKMGYISDSTVRTAIPRAPFALASPHFWRFPHLRTAQTRR